MPDLLFVIDTNKEEIAIKEAQRSASRSSPSSTPTAIPTASTYPIPGNDDAGRAIALYCDLVARAAIDGICAQPAASGVDIGALAKPAGRGACRRSDVQGLDAPRGAADDLKRITGSRPKLGKKLNEAGIFHYWQLADLDADSRQGARRRLRLNGQIEADGWIAQARSSSTPQQRNEMTANGCGNGRHGIPVGRSAQSAFLQTQSHFATRSTERKEPTWARSPPRW